MNVSCYGIKFYFWLNLWYSALDLIKLFIDEIQTECIDENKDQKSRLTIHPKLRTTSSMHHKKAKINNFFQKFDLELRNIHSNLKEELLDDNSSKNSITQILQSEAMPKISKNRYIIKNLKGILSSVCLLKRL